jgi:hypothetical protein
MVTLHRPFPPTGRSLLGTCSAVKRLPVVMREEDLNALRAAVAALEQGLAARLGEIAGKPIELVGRALPETATKAVAAATTKALNAASMQNEPKAASGLLHKALAATKGAVGGSFWFGCSADRASDLDHHHAAVDWGRRT